ncbi:MAG: hypothetical protein KDG89_08390 [Geminicoccaceae bacterium]|nr:hypothetical protein [Geminicoccaceae bacterium]
MRTTLLTIFVMLLALGVACLFAWYVWHQMDGVQISLHGYLALALGVGLTFALGAGLMALVFISSRRGFDDEAGGD